MSWDAMRIGAINMWIQGFNEAKKRLSKPMDGLRDDNRDLRLLVYKQEEQIKDLQRQIQELQS